MVQLTDELIELLDSEASRRGVSRSALIRDALRAELADASEAALADQIVAGYRRIPQVRPDAWGDPTGQADRSAIETLRRLDEEEERPW